MARKKALIIGVNYTGSQHQLNGCINDALNVRDFLVRDRGFSPADMVMLTDASENYGTRFWPSRANLQSAFGWLSHDNGPGDVVWLSYSGHGGQTRNDQSGRVLGYEDTICPVDFEQAGQIDSTELHRAIVSPVNPQARLTILFDCCHSGSACELPYVFRPEADGSINLAVTVQRGIALVTEARGLVHGGFSLDRDRIVGQMAAAESLINNASVFFHSLKHGGNDADASGLATADAQWAAEQKDVWMFSGCADDQTSADANIAGTATGAMSWAFIGTMRECPTRSYVEILQTTRARLVHKYSQIPQLSCGGHYDLNQQLYL